MDKPNYNKRHNNINEAKRNFKKSTRNTNTTAICTDGSAIDNGVGSAAVWIKNGNVEMVYKYHLGQKEKRTVFEAEICGLILAVWMATQKKVRGTVHIYTDSKAALQATQRTHPGPGQLLQDRLFQATEQYLKKYPSSTITVAWIPSHVGLPGNEDTEHQSSPNSEQDTSPSIHI